MRLPAARALAPPVSAHPVVSARHHPAALDRLVALDRPDSDLRPAVPTVPGSVLIVQVPPVDPEVPVARAESSAVIGTEPNTLVWLAGN